VIKKGNLQLGIGCSSCQSGIINKTSKNAKESHLVLINALQP
jgi:hypothetical protein